jgi:DNA-binding beta-propeller fold protein YncE
VLDAVGREIPGAIITYTSGRFLYLAGCGKVRIFDRASRALLVTVETGGDPRRIGFDPATGTAIVTNTGGWVNFIR